MAGRASWVKLDRYGWLHVGRRYRLSASELLVLLAIVCECDYKSRTWTGTKSSLAGELRLSRRAASEALKRLDAEGLLIEEEPFGPNRAGRVFVAVYDDIVRPNGEQLAPDSRPIRARVAPDSRKGARLSRQKTSALGIAGERDKGGARCRHCQRSMKNHPFTSDHEAEPFEPERAVAEPLPELCALCGEPARSCICSKEVPA